jgi:hypothetical protein
MGEYCLEIETTAAKAGISLEKLKCNSNASYYINPYRVYQNYLFCGFTRNF